jgi:hypothetical protein
MKSFLSVPALAEGSQDGLLQHEEQRYYSSCSPVRHRRRFAVGSPAIVPEDDLNGKIPRMP